MKMLLACVPVVLVAAGCISLEIPWERTDSETLTAEEEAFRFELPNGWAHAGDSFLTRDGASLQFIAVMELTENEWSSPDQYAAAIAALPGVTEVACAPVTIGQRDAIALRFLGPPWQSFFGLDWFFPSRDARSYLAYWITEGDREFFLAYAAPTLHYFERDLPVFERLVASFEPLPARTTYARLPR